MNAKSERLGPGRRLTYAGKLGTRLRGSIFRQVDDNAIHGSQHDRRNFALYMLRLSCESNLLFKRISLCLLNSISEMSINDVSPIHSTYLQSPYVDCIFDLNS